MDVPTDTTKLIVAFRNFANSPKTAASKYIRAAEASRYVHGCKWKLHNTDVVSYRSACRTLCQAIPQKQICQELIGFRIITFHLCGQRTHTIVRNGSVVSKYCPTNTQLLKYTLLHTMYWDSETFRSSFDPQGDFHQCCICNTPMKYQIKIVVLKYSGYDKIVSVCVELVHLREYHIVTVLQTVLWKEPQVHVLVASTSGVPRGGIPPPPETRKFWQS
jgi:hypothetical protein